MLSWKGIRPRIRKSKSEKCLFVFFDFSTFVLCFLDISTFHFFSLKVVRLLHLRLRMYTWKGIRQDIKKSKSDKYTFRLFHFWTVLLPFHLSIFWVVGFSSSLYTVWEFRTEAEHLNLKRHPAKIQKVKRWIVYFMIFRRFFFPQSCLTFVLQAAHV